MEVSPYIQTENLHRLLFAASFSAPQVLIRLSVAYKLGLGVVSSWSSV